MNANNKDAELRARIERATGITIPLADARTLRRGECTLRRWFEHECNGNIQRDESTDLPYWHGSGFWNAGTWTVPKPYRIPDREAGALRRIREVCDRNGLHSYIQGDPRGASLYVSHEPLTDSAYNRGVCCYV